MFSFLPNEQKRLLLSEYRIRLVATIFFGIFIIGCLLVISEIPAYVFSRIKMIEVSGQAKRTQDSAEQKKEQKFYQDISDTNAYIDGLTPVNTPQISESLTHVIRVKGNVILNSFSITRKTGVGTLVVSGIAKKRDDLVAFSKALHADATFKSVDVPVSDLAKTKDITFTVTIVGNF